MCDIKAELENSTCRGCLSSDRKLSQLANYDLYWSLLKEDQKLQALNEQYIAMCWECTAMLRRMRAFQIQVQTAYDLLQDLTQIPNKCTLSPLTVHFNNEYDIIFKEKEKEENIIRFSAPIKNETDSTDTAIEVISDFEEEVKLYNNSINNQKHVIDSDNHSSDDLYIDILRDNSDRENFVVGDVLSTEKTTRRSVRQAAKKISRLIQARKHKDERARREVAKPIQKLEKKDGRGRKTIVKQNGQLLCVPIKSLANIIMQTRVSERQRGFSTSINVKEKQESNKAIQSETKAISPAKNPVLTILEEELIRVINSKNTAPKRSDHGDDLLLSNADDSDRESNRTATKRGDDSDNLLFNPEDSESNHTAQMGGDSDGGDDLLSNSEYNESNHSAPKRGDDRNDVPSEDNESNHNEYVTKKNPVLAKLQQELIRIINTKNIAPKKGDRDDLVSKTEDNKSNRTAPKRSDHGSDLLLSNAEDRESNRTATKRGDDSDNLLFNPEDNESNHTAQMGGDGGDDLLSNSKYNESNHSAPKRGDDGNDVPSEDNESNHNEYVTKKNPVLAKLQQELIRIINTKNIAPKKGHRDDLVSKTEDNKSNHTAQMGGDGDGGEDLLSNSKYNESNHSAPKRGDDGIDVPSEDNESNHNKYVTKKNPVLAKLQQELISIINPKNIAPKKGDREDLVSNSEDNKSNRTAPKRGDGGDDSLSNSEDNESNHSKYVTKKKTKKEKPESDPEYIPDTNELKKISDVDSQKKEVEKLKPRNYNKATMQYFNIADVLQYFTKTEMSEQELKSTLEKEDAIVYEKKPHNCNECGRSFIYKRTLHSHTKEAHNKKSIADLEPPRPPQKPSLWRCKTCPRMLRREHLVAHINEHHRHRYSCKSQDCEWSQKMFMSRQDFNEHWAACHKQLTCDLCGRHLKSKTIMMWHMLESHGLGLRQQCSVCGRAFAKRRSLQAHMDLKHGPSEPAELRYCVECDITYCTVLAYRQHVSQVHRPKAKERVSCAVCARTFGAKTTLENHLALVHSGKTKYQCNVCGKYLSKAGSLKVHLNRHKNIKAPKTKPCSICGRMFSNNRTLRFHTYTHTGERPYKCTHCDVAFTQPHCLRTHLVQRHGDDTPVTDTNTGVTPYKCN